MNLRESAVVWVSGHEFQAGFVPRDFSGQVDIDSGVWEIMEPEILSQVTCADKMWQWLSWPGDRAAQNEGCSQSIYNRLLWLALCGSEPVVAPPPPVISVAEHLSGQLGLDCSRAKGPPCWLLPPMPLLLAWMLTLRAGIGISSLISVGPEHR